MKLENFLLALALVLALTFLTMFCILSAKYNKLEEKYVKCEVMVKNFEQAVKRQNEAIVAANKSLNEYSLQLKENNETWSKKLAEQMKKVQNVKSCDDSLDYLKQMVEGLK